MVIWREKQDRDEFSHDLADYTDKFSPSRYGLHNVVMPAARILANDGSRLEIELLVNDKENIHAEVATDVKCFTKFKALGSHEPSQREQNPVPVCDGLLTK